MEAEVATFTGAEAGAGPPSLDSILDGANPEQVLAAQTPSEPEPAAETTAEVKEPAETTETVEAKLDQTTEQDAEPLPQKIEDLLRAVKQANPKLGTELNRIVREDHFKLHGPDGFLSVMPTVEEARAYKAVAPTVDDLNVMADYAQRFDGLDRQYVSDPKGLIETLAQDQQLFPGIVQAFEPALRGNPQMYETAARPFNQNFWQNVMGTVQREGTPEEVELFRAFEQKYLGQMTQGRQQQPGQVHPAQQELESLRAERESFAAQQQEAFFNEVKTVSESTLNAEMKKYIDEKMPGVPEGDREDAAREATSAVWKFINSNPMVKTRLAGIIDNGPRDPQHKKAAIDAVLSYARAQTQKTSTPVIKKWLNRARARSGNGNESRTTTTNQATKDVGSGSPTIGTVKTGPAPAGAPQGWNLMSGQQKYDLIDWNKTDETDAMAYIAGHGDPSKVVLKRR